MFCVRVSSTRSRSTKPTGTRRTSPVGAVYSADILRSLGGRTACVRSGGGLACCAAKLKHLRTRTRRQVWAALIAMLVLKCLQWKSKSAWSSSNLRICKLRDDFAPAGSRLFRLPHAIPWANRWEKTRALLAHAKWTVLRGQCWRMCWLLWHIARMQFALACVPRGVR